MMINMNMDRRRERRKWNVLFKWTHFVDSMGVNIIPANEWNIYAKHLNDFQSVNWFMSMVYGSWCMVHGIINQ